MSRLSHLGERWQRLERAVTVGREVGADSQDVGEPGKSKQLLGSWIMEMGFLEPSSLGCAELGASGGIQVDMSWSRAGP